MKQKRVTTMVLRTTMFAALGAVALTSCSSSPKGETPSGPPSPTYTAIAPSVAANQGEENLSANQKTMVAQMLTSLDAFAKTPGFQSYLTVAKKAPGSPYAFGTLLAGQYLGQTKKGGWGLQNTTIDNSGASLSLPIRKNTLLTPSLSGDNWQASFTGGDGKPSCVTIPPNRNLGYIATAGECQSADQRSGLVTMVQLVMSSQSTAVPEPQN